jgi:hypothetical protein
MIALPGKGTKKYEFGVIHHFLYRVEGGGELEVATTRPETILGDSALAVHPEDPRYVDFIGRRAIHPFTGQPIPIVADPILVDRELGTGVVKSTTTWEHHGKYLVLLLFIDFISRAQSRLDTTSTILPAVCGTTCRASISCATMARSTSTASTSRYSLLLLVVVIIIVIIFVNSFISSLIYGLVALPFRPGIGPNGGAAKGHRRAGADVSTAACQTSHTHMRKPEIDASLSGVSTKTRRTTSPG